METTYRVVLKGIKPALDQIEAKDKLAALFKISREKIDELLSSSQFVVKKGLPFEAAAKYQAAIDAAGGNCIVEPEIEPTIKKPGSPISQPPLVTKGTPPTPSPLAPTLSQFSNTASTPLEQKQSREMVTQKRKVSKALGALIIIFLLTGIYLTYKEVAYRHEKAQSEKTIYAIVPTGEWSCGPSDKNGTVSSESFRVYVGQAMEINTPTGKLLDIHGLGFNTQKRQPQVTEFYDTYGVWSVSGNAMTFKWHGHWHNPNTQERRQSIDLLQKMQRIDPNLPPVDPRYMDNKVRGIDVLEDEATSDEIRVNEITPTRFSGNLEVRIVRPSQTSGAKKEYNIRDAGLIQCNKIVAVTVASAPTAGAADNTPRTANATLPAAPPIARPQPLDTGYRYNKPVTLRGVVQGIDNNGITLPINNSSGYPAIILSKPIDVIADTTTTPPKAEEEVETTERNVLVMQLVVFDQPIMVKYKAAKGQQVEIQGSLFHADNANHHTKVLMSVKSIEMLAGATVPSSPVSTTTRPTEPIAAATKSNSGGANAPDTMRPKEPLEAYPLASLKMVDATTQKGVTYASVRAGSSVYRVRKGNYLGQNFGVITEITENQITLNEQVQDPSGNWIERKMEMVRQNGAGR